MGATIFTSAENQGECGVVQVDDWQSFLLVVSARDEHGSEATVRLTAHEAAELRDALTEWLGEGK